MKQQACAGISRVLIVIVIVGMMTIGATAQTEKILYSFTGGGDGGSPVSSTVFDSKGNLYGTTSSGGANFGGTVFELSPGSNGTWSEKVIHSFAFNGIDGFDPLGSVVFDSKGNLYGTTAAGGPLGAGTVFQLVQGSGGTWTENILYSFSSLIDGGEPTGPVVLDSAGNVFGSTYYGGTYGFGTVFEVVRGSNGTWTEKVLHSFTGGNDGSSPYYSPVILDGAGNIYGIAQNGGLHDYGVVFGVDSRHMERDSFVRVHWRFHGKQSYRRLGT
jgi:uncharacterized repeat protein (TIGR03803 family)